MLTFSRLQHSCISCVSPPWLESRPQISSSLSSGSQGWHDLSWLQRAPNPVLALAELTSTLAHRLASSSQARIMESGHPSSEPVHIISHLARPFPHHHLQYIVRPSPCACCKTGHDGRCSQDCTSARSNFRTRTTKSSTTLVFDPPRVQTPTQDQAST